MKRTRKKLTAKQIKLKKKAKALYDALRYRKKKLINLIEKMVKDFKNIYNNKDSNELSNYEKIDIELLYKRAIYEKNKEARDTLLRLGNKYKGGEKDFKMSWAETLQKDLQANIYGENTKNLPLPVKYDMQNFNALMNGLTDEQKLEFLNSSSYYGARRYQKPPADSLTFLLQVLDEGKSYIVDNLIKYYEDKGLPIPELKHIKDIAGYKKRHNL